MTASHFGSYKCANESILDTHLKKRFEHEGSRSNWKIRHPSNVELYKNKKCEVCIEIGLARGEFAATMLREVPSITEYYGIDPFLGGYDSADAMSSELAKFNNKENGTNDRWANTLLYQLRSYECKFRLYKGFSHEISANFRNESIDCLFIDGDHTYSGVKRDLQHYIPLMKSNGLVVFDDYNFVGVKKALDELTTLTHLKLISLNSYNQYYIIIPQLGGTSLKLPA